MPRAATISRIVSWPFLLPGNIACNALGLVDHTDLVRMLVNSLFWTVLGVFVVVFAV